MQTRYYLRILAKAVSELFNIDTCVVLSDKLAGHLCTYKCNQQLSSQFRLLCEDAAWVMVMMMSGDTDNENDT